MARRTAEMACAMTVVKAPNSLVACSEVIAVIVDGGTSHLPSLLHHRRDHRLPLPLPLRHNLEIHFLTKAQAVQIYHSRQKVASPTMAMKSLAFLS